MFLIPRKKKQAGFTLIELVMVIIILSIMAAIGTQILNAGMKGYLGSRNLIAADAQITVALERMQRDIRQLRSPADIVTIAANQFVLRNTSGNSITYSLSGTSLMRQTNAATSQVLADGIQSLAFSYFDSNLTSTAVAANVRYVTIQLNITLNNTNFTVKTSVYLRNAP